MSQPPSVCGYVTVTWDIEANAINKESWRTLKSVSLCTIFASLKVCELVVVVLIGRIFNRLVVSVSRKYLPPTLGHRFCIVPSFPIVDSR